MDAMTMIPQVSLSHTHTLSVCIYLQRALKKNLNKFAYSTESVWDESTFMLFYFEVILLYILL